MNLPVSFNRKKPLFSGDQMKQKLICTKGLPVYGMKNYEQIIFNNL